MESVAKTIVEDVLKIWELRGNMVSLAVFFTIIVIYSQPANI